MTSFNRLIGCWMVVWCEADLNIECLLNAAVEVCNKGISIVGHGWTAKSKPWYPLNKSLAAFWRGGWGHWIGLKPPWGPIQDCKEIFGPLRFYQRSNDIKVNHWKSLIRDIKMTNPRVDRFWLFGDLAWVTCLHKLFHLHLHTRPIVVFSSSSESLSSRRMVLMMKKIKDQCPEGFWDQRTQVVFFTNFQSCVKYSNCNWVTNYFTVTFVIDQAPSTFGQVLVLSTCPLSTNYM